MTCRALGRWWMWLFHVLQVPTTSGDSGSLPFPDKLSVLLRPLFFFFLFIYHFGFSHLHSVDQKPWGQSHELAVFCFNFVLFNTLQSHAQNATSGSPSAGTTTHPHPFCKNSFLVKFQVFFLFFFFPFNWLDTKTSQTISLVSWCVPIHELLSPKETPPRPLRPSRAACGPFHHKGWIQPWTLRISSRLPTGLERLLQHGFYSVLDTNMAAASYTHAAVLLFHHAARRGAAQAWWRCHAVYDYLNCHCIQSEQHKKAFVKNAVYHLFILAQRRGSSVTIHGRLI